MFIQWSPWYCPHITPGPVVRSPRTLSCLPPPPLSVGAGLGNRATHFLWHRTRFQSCRLGFPLFLDIFGVMFSSRFLYSLFAFPCIFPAPPPLRVLWRWFSLATASWVFLSIFFSYFAGFVALPFRGVGVGFRTAVSFWGQLGTNYLEFECLVPKTGLEF